MTITNKQLIVIVQSRPNDASNRQSIRETWGKSGTNLTKKNLGAQPYILVNCRNDKWLIKQDLLSANDQTSVLFLIGTDPSMNSDQKILVHTRKMYFY